MNSGIPVVQYKDIQCYLCNSSNMVFDFSLSSAGNIKTQTFYVLRCLHCSLQATYPVPDDLDDYYGRSYYTNVDRPGIPALTGWKRQLRNNILARYGYPCDVSHNAIMKLMALLFTYRIIRRYQYILPYEKNGIILDIGCGFGEWLERCRELPGWQVIGVDPSKSAVKICEQHGIQMFEGTIFSLPFADHTISHIRFWHSLEHMKDPLAVLVKSHALLKPGGTIVISVPNAASLYARLFKKFWPAWDIPRHLFHFTPDAVKYLVKKSDFKDIRIRTIKWGSDTLIGGLRNLLQRHANGRFVKYFDPNRTSILSQNVHYITQVLGFDEHILLTARR